MIPTYNDIIAAAVAQGCDEGQVRAGSMPEESLALIVRHLNKSFGYPLTGLHVGCFVGVSLAYLLAHTTGFAASIDANIQHRGIEWPAENAMMMLDGFGLADRVLNVVGYSLGKTPPNDGIANYSDLNTKAAPIEPQPGAWSQLRALEAIAPGAFDWALIDGFHDGSHLLHEIAHCYDLLHEGGLLIVDDIHPNWPGLRTAYDSSLQDGLGLWSEVTRDGRIGILRKV